MKKNTRKTGSDYQNWVEKWLLKNHPGSAVHNQKTVATKLPSGVWVSKRNDILGCIDLIALIPDKEFGSTRLKFIQASKHTAVTKRLKEFLAVPWNIYTYDVELWQKRENGETIIRRLYYHEGGSELIEVGKIIRGKYYRLSPDTPF